MTIIGIIGLVLIGISFFAAIIGWLAFGNGDNCGLLVFLTAVTFVAGFVLMLIEALH